MLNFDNQQEIKNALDLARRDINRQKPDLALERLRRIERQIDGADLFERTHYSLLLGEAFSAKRDPGAETYLLEAEERIKALPVRNRELELEVLVRDLELEMRVYEQLGKFYTFVEKRPSKAKNYFSKGKAAAVEINPETAADIDLRIIAIDLTIDKDPELENFQILRRVGGEGYLAQDELAAWRQHLDRKSASQSPALRYARNFNARDEQYFQNLLGSVKDLR
ncbi:MAG: hypothetical protein JW902_10160 [Syntrophaceae bacterium]|nr:hypothetical protein [Syntrophaceae bacterium]